MTDRERARANAHALRPNGLSIRQIAARLGIPSATVGGWLRGRGEWNQLRNCQLCGEPFIVGSGNQRFCSPGHARKHTQLFGSPSVLDGYRERALDLEAEIAKLRDELASAHDRRAA